MITRIHFPPSLHLEGEKEMIYAQFKLQDYYLG